MNKLIPVFIILIVFSTVPAFSHKLLAVDPENTMKVIATHIPDPSFQSWYTLEEFERHGQSHWYSFIGSKDQEILIQVLVPDLPSTRNFNPSFDLLIGDEKLTAQVTNIRYVEPYSNTNWFIKAEMRAKLPDNGIYYIRAHDELNHYSIGDVGKFSLAIGENESFSFIENLMIPISGIYVNLFFENLTFVWISLVLVLVLIVTLLAVIKMEMDKK